MQNDDSLWVVPPSEIEPLEVPESFDRAHRVILHAILPHGGLSKTALVALLPYSIDDVERRVSKLKNVGMLDDDNGELQVRLAAYPLVRRDLQIDGFLIDAI